MIAALRIAAKELRVEGRSRELLAAGLLTGLLAVAVGAVALGGSADFPAVAAGVLWLALAFASTLVLARVVTTEIDRGTMEVLLLLPVDRGAVFAGKALAAFAMLALLAAVLAPIALVFLGAPLGASLLALAPILLLGLAGLAGAGVLLASLAARTRAREALLPVLLLPVALPILLSAIPSTAAILGGRGLPAQGLTLLAGYDLALSAVSYLLFDFATEG